MYRIGRYICLFCVLLVVSLAYGQPSFPQLLPHNVVSVEWSPQGDMYVTGRVDGTVSIYDSTGLLQSIPNAHGAAVYGLAFSPSGQRLATGGDDGNLYIWNTTDGEMLAEFSDLGGFVESIDWNPDGDFIWAVASQAGVYIISANVVTGSYSVPQQLQMGPSSDIALKPDNTLIAIGQRGSDLRLIDTSSHETTRLLDATPVVDILFPPFEFTTTVAWHTAGNIVANGKINGRINVWDLGFQSDEMPLLTLDANSGAVDDAVIPFEFALEDLIFMSDGDAIASISADGTLRTWDATSGILLSDTNVGTDILSAAFSPDGSQLVYNPYTSVDTPPTILEAPNADAGLDQILDDVNPFGSENVTLNGSGSADPDGTISTYTWLKDGTQIASGANPTVSLDVGTHTIMLAVTDDDGMVDTDDVVITINALE